MSKPKVGFYWGASCGGCQETIIDLGEGLLDVAGAVDIVFWPIAMDFKREDVEAMPDNSMAAVIISGAVRTDEQKEMAELLRRKAQLVFANGSCAHTGGVVGLAGLFSRETILTQLYATMPQEKTIENGHELALPRFHDTVKPLNRVIDVDYYIPGCPTSPEVMGNALTALLENALPPKGSVFGEKKALCDSCSLRDSKPESIEVKRFKRTYEAEWDPEKCFLDQDIMCLGPATRGGCGERCIKANMPCQGCFGPLDNVRDHGAKAVSLIASIIDSDDEQELEQIVDSLPDPAGLFYRYTLADLLSKGRSDD